MRQEATNGKFRGTLIKANTGHWERKSQFLGNQEGRIPANFKRENTKKAAENKKRIEKKGNLPVIGIGNKKVGGGKPHSHRLACDQKKGKGPGTVAPYVTGTGARKNLAKRPLKGRSRSGGGGRGVR